MPAKVAYGERARGVFSAIRDTEVGVTTNRAYFSFVGDSNQFRTPGDAGSATPPVGGIWQGASKRLHELYGTYGFPLFGLGTGRPEDPVSVGFYAGSPTDLVAQASGDSDFAKSFPRTDSGTGEGSGNMRDRWAGFMGKIAAGTTTGVDGTALARVDVGSILLNETTEDMLWAFDWAGATPAIAEFGARLQFVGTLGHSTVSAGWPATLAAGAGTLAIPKNVDSTHNRCVDMWSYDTFAGSTGPLRFGWMQLLKAGTSGSPTTSLVPSGVAVGNLYQQGGFTLRRFLIDLIFGGRAPLAEHMRAVKKFADYFVFVDAFLGNDVSETGKSVLPDGSAGPDNSNTAAGHAQNIATLCEWVYKAWVEDNGFNPSNLLILQWGYHPQEDEPYASTQPILEEAAVAAAGSGSTYTGRLAVIRGSELITAADMESDSLYDGVDTAHLSCAGFEELGLLNVEALVEAVGLNPIVSVIGYMVRLAINPADPGLTTHFKISSRTNCTVYLSDNSTEAGAFVDLADATAGLIVAITDTSLPASFAYQSSTSGDDSGLVGTASTWTPPSSGGSEGGGTLSNRFPRFQGAN